ncbi:MAG: hypothetical protein OEW75_03285, partial [Cyclobacteriaceae bacterium]|nr:hypothetical protein [Cyclobacteriaceae bacterium]
MKTRIIMFKSLTVFFFMISVSGFSQGTNQLDSIITYAWDQNLGDWVENYRNVYQYNNGITTNTGYSKDIENNIWANSSMVSSDNSIPLQSTVISYSWDDIARVFVNKSKTEYLKNDTYQLWATYNWNPTSSSWEGSFKIEDKYDSQGNHILFASFYGWNTTTNDWIGSTKNEFTDFNANGDYATALTYQWNTTTHSWDLNVKSEYTFNANGFKTQMLVFGWNEINSSWDYSTRRDYTYIDFTKLLTATISYWNNSISDWVPQSQTVYTYNTENKVSQKLGQKWDVNYTTWYDINRTEYTYTGLTIEQTEYNWDITFSEWITIRYKKNIENNEGLLTYSELWVYNEAERNIQPYEKVFIELSSTNKITLRENYRWDIQNSSWKGTQKTTKQYNIIDKIATEILFNWNITSSDWENQKKYVYFYDGLITAINDISDLQVSGIYPNPFNDRINISSELFNCNCEIQLYNIHGQLIIQQVIDKNIDT